LDRGTQYASKVYHSLLKENGFVGGMSRLGNCWVNAVAEIFWQLQIKGVAVDSLLCNYLEKKRLNLLIND